MLLSIVDNFLTICSWWILPLLIVSWLLGSWFWNLTTGKKLKMNIKNLETNVSNLHSEIKGHIDKINHYKNMDDFIGHLCSYSDNCYEFNSVKNALCALKSQLS